jgi:putative FmdB family regulatory protein
MPLYEFDCRECGARFEKLVPKAGETRGLKCPACGGRRLEERISAFASVSKGNVRGTASSGTCAPTGG